MSGQGRPGAPGRDKSVREVACPSCGKFAPFDASNPSRPFCSARCRTTDLGGWASERYRIPAKPGDDEAESPPAGDDPKD